MPVLAGSSLKILQWCKSKETLIIHIKLPQNSESAQSQDESIQLK